MKTTVNERIKMLRTHLKLNPQQFAAAANMTVSTLYRVEGGEVEPRSKTILDIQKAFNVDHDWLVNGKGEMTFGKSEAPAKEKSIYESILESALMKSYESRIAFYEEMIRNLTGTKTLGKFKAVVNAGDHKRSLAAA